MEWNRGPQPAQQAAQPASHSAAANTARKNKLKFLQGMRLASVILLFSATALVVALVWYLVVGGGATGENKALKSDKMQAVFLNGGQVYFGKITDLNSNYLKMGDIYYLRVNQQVQPNQQNTNQQATQNDTSLVKLGCELHGPEDSMVINREQVIFWENLKDDGQVAKAVAEYKQQNPNGQKCETTTDQSSSTNQNTNAATGTQPTTRH